LQAVIQNINAPTVNYIITFRWIFFGTLIETETKCIRMGIAWIIFELGCSEFLWFGSVFCEGSPQRCAKWYLACFTLGFCKPEI